jgi:tellurite methyltransferase
VLDAAERAARVGSPLDCPLCDRAELPDGLRVVRTTKKWDERNIPTTPRQERTMPAALRRDHRVAAGTWGRLRVEEGRLRFTTAAVPTIDVPAIDVPTIDVPAIDVPAIDAVVAAGQVQPIPPEVPHRVEPLGAVRFAVEFLRR